MLSIRYGGGTGLEAMPLNFMCQFNWALGHPYIEQMLHWVCLWGHFWLKAGIDQLLKTEFYLQDHTQTGLHLICFVSGFRLEREHWLFLGLELPGSPSTLQAWTRAKPWALRSSSLLTDQIYWHGPILLITLHEHMYVRLIEDCVLGTCHSAWHVTDNA